MTGFDAVLIGAIGGVVCVFIGLIANRNGDNSKSKQWGTAFAVGIAFIAIICCLALGFRWPSDILAGFFPGHPGGSTGYTEPTYATEPTKDIAEPESTVATIQETTFPKSIPADDDMVTVPLVVGMEQVEGIRELTKYGLAYEVWAKEENIGEEYYIIDQSIPEGCSVPAGTKVLLELSSKEP